MKILKQIENHQLFSAYYLKANFLPEPFFQDISLVKAIVLGADPSNPQGNTFKYVFGLEKGENAPFFIKILDNLKHIGLDLSNIYVQNLCRNYFTKVTDENPYYKDVAKEFWLPILKEELDNLFPADIPVFVTTWQVMEVIAPSARKFRNRKSAIFREGVAFKENELNRTAFALIRGGHGYYNLDREDWKGYRKTIIEALE